ncbi:MAG: energy-coupling factor ABC transporter ATP-binding protein [Synergistaceae bacterium]|nr:energy-coupling factor ABC transporter ATP-binding protein [Synergistaceae bacterium]
MDPRIIYEIKNLTHSYEKGPKTLDIDYLRINEGSVTGIVGPNGCGKSTLLKVLALLEPYTGGSLFFGGIDPSGKEVDIRKNVTYLLQNSYLLKRSVFENIAYGLRLRNETEDLEERVHDALGRVGLSPSKFAQRPWYRLSGGEVQRVALAARLALHPKVLILDEPTANVDESSALLVKEAAVSAWKEWGTTVIVATHDLPWLIEVSTDIISLFRGKIVGHGTENLIHGPWTRENGSVVKTLSDGQKIHALIKGEAELHAAVVNPSDIELITDGEVTSSGVNVLRGTVTSMSLERATGSALISVQTGDIILKSRMPVEKIKEVQISPASEVTLTFSQEDVRWI